MIALHPPLSGMPSAFVALLVFVELLRLSSRFRLSLEVTRHVLVIAVVGSTLAVFLSGYQASGSLGELLPQVQEELGRHHAWGRGLLINSLLMGTFTWIARRATHGKGVILALYFVTLAVQVVLSVYVGFMGGSLVFDRGLGVSAR
jgi:uncharacterized membrane protein